jgi:hypothetical protein
METELNYTAFVGTALLASGPLKDVLSSMKNQFDEDPGTLFLVFNDQTGRPVDFNLRGTLSAVLEKALPPKSPRGRPKLGVVAREISLLPRHWEWLEQQPNGASAAIRRLVDDARKREPDEQRERLAIDATATFLSAMAGNLPYYEEATRALYARDRSRFVELIGGWPADVRQHAQRMATY